MTNNSNKRHDKAPTSRIVQVCDRHTVLCDDGSVWIVKYINGASGYKNEWQCLIEPFNGKQYAYK